MVRGVQCTFSREHMYLQGQRIWKLLDMTCLYFIHPCLPHFPEHHLGCASRVSSLLSICAVSCHPTFASCLGTLLFCLHSPHLGTCHFAYALGIQFCSVPFCKLSPCLVTSFHSDDTNTGFIIET